MDYLAIKNFRTIKDSSRIKIKPITIFIGKNSCGKSSFLRIFPLLKQSLERDISEPLLWFGDYVDFGSFENIQPVGNKKKNFLMSFNVTIDNRFRSHFRLTNYRSGTKKVKCKINIKFEKNKISFFELKYCKQNVKCKFNSDTDIVVKINDAEIQAQEYRWIKASRALLPSPNFEQSSSFLELMFGGFYESEIDDKETNSCELKVLYNQLVQVNKKQGFYSESFRSMLGWFSINELRDSLGSKIVKSENSEELLNKFNNLMVFFSLQRIIDDINQSILKEINDVFYIKPIRANASRYYRIQGLNVDRVNSDGSNLPMVLYNLDEKDRNNFEKWCNKIFNIRFSVHRELGHVSLTVKEDNEREINLADAGYGYSQVLPIIVQLWLLISRKKNKKDIDISHNNEFKVVIEQPELHLHPAFQAKLIDVFVGVIKEARKNKLVAKIIFETHSESMINYLGYLVSKNSKLKNLINIVMVEMENGISNFTQTIYNESGFIENWPIGFLAP